VLALYEKKRVGRQKNVNAVKGRSGPIDGKVGELVKRNGGQIKTGSPKIVTGKSIPWDWERGIWKVTSLKKGKPLDYKTKGVSS